MKQIFQAFTAFSIVLTFCVSNSSFGAGYEKAIFWSGKHAGKAGSAVSSVQGGESLFYNPAGLVSGSGPGDIGLNFSPTFGGFSGPITETNAKDRSKRPLSPVAGIVGSYRPGEKVGFGIGVFASGGTKAVFEDLKFDGFNKLNPDSAAELSVVEYSMGAAGEVVPGLRIGAAWRIVHVDARLVSPVEVSTLSALTEVSLEELTDTQYNGFRFGIQYAPKDAGYGLGITARTSINFKASGKGSGRVEQSGTLSSMTGGSVSAVSRFPLQISTGGHVELLTNLTTFFEWTWTRYSENDYIGLTGDVFLPSGIAGGANFFSLITDKIPQHWKPMHNFRLGFEYTGVPDWTLRTGYVYTTQVTPAAFARPSFAAPGVGHTFVLGAGTKLAQEKLELNFAGEYSYDSGKVSAAEALKGKAAGTKAGEYRADGYVAHIGLTYIFD